MKRLFLALALPVLGACSGERATPEDFYAVAPQIITYMEQDARQNQPGRVADGPLYVNLDSFRRASASVTGSALEVDSISLRLDEPTQASQEQALLCDTTSGFGGCWVRKYGIWINWNQAYGTREEIRATVRSTSTDRRYRPSNFCDRVWKLTYRKQGAQWALADKKMILDCRAES
ncbi:hypothetical protein [Longimicrobium terrae]|uniref:Lipoprotein n=1 Tax=Longimicrobium terrae TaxID=1639882 RepID=A0A841H693_9BACT|nr:hypothetical protein [Longimicrobium terrae]MBB4639133.1 hypothetical protein [Longimicrobium terrae]MBB6073463.1 hypothetical protein [Longimicrobium terrae]NNC32549.1 hypothetical protein [Longimicrobium terrae]